MRPLRNPETFRGEGSKVFVPGPVNAQLVQGVVAVAKRKAADSERKENSAETRVETAYDAVHNCAIAVLSVAGYRVKAGDGAHVQVLEAACCLAGVGFGTFERLDALRNLRNTANYTGQRCSDEDVSDAHEVMRAVIPVMLHWVRTKRPDLKV